jgi:hypothetical protein
MLTWEPYGAYVYPFIRLFMLKLAGQSSELQQKVLSEPVRIAAYILPYPDRNRVLAFFEKDARLLKMRERFPAKKTELQKSHMEELRRYYSVLYPILVLKRELLVNMFAEEIANQEYDRIYAAFPAWLLQRRKSISGKQLDDLQHMWGISARLLRDTFREMGTELVTEKSGQKLLKKLEENLWSGFGRKK